MKRVTVAMVAVAMLVAVLASAQVANEIWDTTILDDYQLGFGTDSDFLIEYDEDGDNRLEVTDADDNLVLHVTDAGATIDVVIVGTLSATTLSGAMSPTSIDLPDGNGTILYGDDDDIQAGYDEAGEDRLEWDDGTNRLMSLTDAGTTGTLEVTGGILVPQIGPSGDDDLIGLAADAVTVSGELTASSLVTGGDIGIAADKDLIGLGANAVTVNGSVSTTGTYSGQFGGVVYSGSAGTLAGRFTAYGNVTTTGGSIWLYEGGGLDSQTDYWRLDMDSTTGDLELSGVGGTSNLGEILTVDETTGAVTFGYAVGLDSTLTPTGNVIMNSANEVVSTGNLTLSSDADDGMYFDCGSVFYWRDVDNGDAVMATLSSVTGDFSITGGGLVAGGDIGTSGDLAVNGGDGTSTGDFTWTAAGGDFNVASDFNVVEANDGGTTLQRIWNTAGSGSTDELCELRFLHHDYYGGSIFSVREGDYGASADKDASLEFHVAANAALALALTLDDDLSATFEGAVVHNTATFTNNDATPSVAGANVWYSNNGWDGITTVTGLDGGIEGQIVYIVGQDADCDFIDGGTLYLAGNWTATPGTTLTVLMLASNVAWELDRSDTT